MNRYLLPATCYKLRAMECISVSLMPRGINEPAMPSWRMAQQQAGLLACPLALALPSHPFLNRAVAKLVLSTKVMRSASALGTLENLGTLSAWDLQQRVLLRIFT